LLLNQELDPDNNQDCATEAFSSFYNANCLNKNTCAFSPADSNNYLSPQCAAKINNKKYIIYIGVYCQDQEIKEGLTGYSFTRQELAIIFSTINAFIAFVLFINNNV
jgi:hypothetical protein